MWINKRFTNIQVFIFFCSFDPQFIILKVFYSSFKVRYSETDRMGYLYYGNYAAYFEVARVEALRELGVVYKDLEDEGFILPVRTFSIRYKQPALYDDTVTVETRITSFNGTRIQFTYNTVKDGSILNEAETELVFCDKTSGRPCKAPDHIAALISSVISE